MVAVEAPEPGGPEALKLVERPVAAAGAGRSADRSRRGGGQPARYPAAQRALCAAAWSIDCPRARSRRDDRRGGSEYDELTGERVCALVAGGGYAEYCVAPAGTCLPVPEVLTLPEAAAMPETLFTVWINLFERGFAADGDVGPGPWRDQRHRHDGDPARQAVRADGHRHVRDRTQNAPARSKSGRRTRSTTTTRTLPKKPVG